MPRVTHRVRTKYIYNRKPTGSARRRWMAGAVRDYLHAARTQGPKSPAAQKAAWRMDTHHSYAAKKRIKAAFHLDFNPHSSVAKQKYQAAVREHNQVQRVMNMARRRVGAPTYGSGNRHTVHHTRGSYGQGRKFR